MDLLQPQDLVSAPASSDDGPEVDPPRRPSRLRSAAAGVLSAGAALAVGELVAGLSSRLTSPVISVGNRVVDAVPGSLKDFAIQTFGTNDKKALLVGIYSVAALFGLALGVAASRRFWIGATGLAAFGTVGVWAARAEVDAPWWAGGPSVGGAVAGIVALGLLLATISGADRPSIADRTLARLGAVTRLAPNPADRAEDSTPNIRPALDESGPLGRRGFLKMTGAVVVVGAAAAGGGRWLQGRFSAAASRLAVVLPRPRTAARALPTGADLGVAGIAPFITPNHSFYRIDTNLTVPQIAAETWSLRIKGMVDREVSFTYDEILAMPMVEERITLTCVSNEVGGALVGTAQWLGTPLVDLIERAGIATGADQVVGRAFDGFTTGFPVEVLRDGRPALLAVGMNGEPLPLAHGFPARIVVPGLYGFVSATKWLTEIELTTFDAFDQYWVRRGWSARGPIKTMTRIDTPRGLQRVAPGRVPIGGVAWAQTRGIVAVQVRVDDGPWIDAELGAQDSKLTWRQWVHHWDATPGRHQVTARAVDATGRPQAEERAKPFPAGASGWHSIAVLVGDT